MFGFGNNDDEGKETAAMRVLMREYGMLGLYTGIGSPPAAVTAERERIKTMRAKVSAMPEGADKRAYEGWLRYAESAADESERAWALARKGERAYQEIARP